MEIPYSKQSSTLACWTRIQAEAGQALDLILVRKEIERRHGNGVFYWGVGNSIGQKVSLVRQSKGEVPVLFTEMLSKPKVEDVNPGCVFAWTSYLSPLGQILPLPDHVLVTSRGNTRRGFKSSHYAIVCHSGTELAHTSGGKFDPSAYRNAGPKGSKVGHSQVTALVVQERPEIPDAARYSICARAQMVEPFFVKLVNPVHVSESNRLLQVPPNIGRTDWLELVMGIRRGP